MIVKEMMRRVGIQMHMKWLNYLMLLHRLHIRGKGGFWCA